MTTLQSQIKSNLQSALDAQALDDKEGKPFLTGVTATKESFSNGEGTWQVHFTTETSSDNCVRSSFVADDELRGTVKVTDETFVAAPGLSHNGGYTFVLKAKGITQLTCRHCHKPSPGKPTFKNKALIERSVAFAREVMDHNFAFHSPATYAKAVHQDLIKQLSDYAEDFGLDILFEVDWSTVVAQDLM